MFLQGLVRELLRQFGFQLRRHQFKKIRIVRQKRLGYVLAAKEQLIVPRSEFHTTPKMTLIQSTIRGRAFEFHS